MKHLLKILLVAMLSMVASQAMAYDFEVDGIYYKISISWDNRILGAVVCGSGLNDYSSNNEYSGSVVIPETVTYNDTTYNVTGIATEAFQRCKKLTSITIPNNATGIADNAFKDCSGLKEIAIGKNMTYIGQGAFWGCTSLSIAEFASIESLCNIRFSNFSNPLSFAQHLYIGGKEITDVVIPNTVTKIGNYAFSGCTSITTVTIPNSVTSIGSYTFSGCTGLTSLTIPNSVTSIGDVAFSGCTGLTSVTIPNSVTSIGYSAFENCSGLTTLTIPNSVTSIGSYAFSGCTGLTSLTIPNSVTSISKGAFSGCTNITSVTIPNSVTSLGEKAFQGCSGILSIDCNIPSVSTSFESPFYETYFSRVIIGDNVKSIGDDAFYNAKSITSVSIGKSVTSIGHSAFHGCSGLTSVTFPESVSSIEAYAFLGCTGLTSVTIPESVTSIGNFAFAGCTDLTSVIINCNTFVSKSFTESNTLAKIFGTQVQNYSFGEKVSKIGAYACYNCSELLVLKIGVNVKEIGDYAFYGCEKIKTINIPDGVKTIPNSAFEGCKRVTELRIGTSLENIGSKAFYGCPLVRIYNYAEYPQDCASDVFSIVKPNCKLYVPEDSQDLYRVHKDWYAFNIHPLDAEALPVKTIGKGALTNGNVYDLNGRKQKHMNRGINILRFKDGTTKKVVIK